MPFKPINPRNAILEAVVSVHCNRPLTEFEMDAVRELHPKFARDLPKLDTMTVATLYLGPGAPPARGPNTPAPPVTMAAYKKDGTLETRLILQGQSVTVNFLLYSRWRDLGPKACLWIREVLTAALCRSSPNMPPLAIMALQHQIVDVFKWDGDEASMTIADLFKSEPARLPKAVWTSVGSPWQAAHTTVVPYVRGPLPRAALVDLLNVDLNDEPSVGWRLRLEHTSEVRFEAPLQPEMLFVSPEADATPLVEAVMNDLHARNRDMMQGLLRPDMLSRIGMGAA